MEIDEDSKAEKPASAFDKRFESGVIGRVQRGDARQTLLDIERLAIDRLRLPDHAGN